MARGLGTKKEKGQNEDICELVFVDSRKVGRVRRAMKKEKVFFAMAETFKVLGDPTRIKILYALSREELCVCDLANLLGKSSSNVSHQLRVLRNMKLVKYRREGKVAYYSLDDEHIYRLFKEGLKHAEE